MTDQATDQIELASEQVDLFAGVHSRSGKDIQALLKDADVISGADLLKKDEKLELEGVPFIITKIVFRDAGRIDRDTKLPLDYVSVEATTGDLRDVVFNDGSTGIRRQLVQYALGKSLKFIKETPTETVWVDASEIFNVDDTDTPIPGIAEGISYTTDLALVAKRGLRISRYTNEYGDSQTFYLA